MTQYQGNFSFKTSFIKKLLKSKWLPYFWDTLYIVAIEYIT